MPMSLHDASEDSPAFVKVVDLMQSEPRLFDLQISPKECGRSHFFTAKRIASAAVSKRL